MAQFFIKRPVFAWVLAIVLMVMGLLSLRGLPVSQYPQIAPPAIMISASYRGASAKTAEDSVTQVIEQKMSGLDNLLYMSATSDAEGTVTVTLTFAAGTNPDIAQVQVQNKLSSAIPLLPAEVQAQGVMVEKASSAVLLVAGFISEDGSMREDDLADYVASNIQDPISRIDGVGRVQLYGFQYALRIWLDPYKLESFNLNPGDVVAAVQEQNTQVSAGKLGESPQEPGTEITATITAQSRLRTADEFKHILLKVNTDGSEVLLGDVAKVEIGSESYSVNARLNGQPAAALGITLATGKNALATAELVKGKLAQLEKFYPKGMKTIYPYDTTPFIDISIHEVVKTLVEAIVLVFLVMLLFLHNLRATIIPTIAVPVVLLGTFAILFALGYTINTLTMFALVLAIGLLVDDAIVVVENVERIMHEERLDARAATEKSMREISSALVGIGMVLCAVFVPMAFFGGSTGIIYRQFSITIVAAVLLSVFVALVLTPTLCIGLLSKAGHQKKGFSAWFERNFDRLTSGYGRSISFINKRALRFMLIYVALGVGMALMFMRLPTGFLPNEDQGIVMVMTQLPAGSTKEQTSEVLEDLEHYFLTQEKDNVKDMLAVAGWSFTGFGTNTGVMFINLADWEQREGAENKVDAIVGRAMQSFSQRNDSLTFAFAPPAILELGNATGFDFYLSDNAALGHERLTEIKNQLIAQANQNTTLQAVRANGLPDAPQYHLEIDQLKARALGVSIGDINQTISTAFGSNYINDFIDRGRVKKVYAQGQSADRMTPNDLLNWKIRNRSGEMVSMDTFATGDWISGSPRLERYNGLPAMEILGEPTLGMSTGDAMAEVEKLIEDLPAGVSAEWTGMSYQERQSSGQTGMLYGLSILVVFLCLAALYEDWTVPFAVMLIIPLAVLGAVLATRFTGLNNDIYFQVGLLTTIGLGSKNAIMIVEFAKTFYESGEDLYRSAYMAAKLRLRPILMTSLAFGVGVLPLATSTGAGSGAQRAVGIGVLGGVIAATVLGCLFVPLFYIVVTRVLGKKKSADIEPAIEQA